MPPASADPGTPTSAPTAGTRAWLWGRVRRERQQAADLTRRAQWLQAELENVRKQAERDRAQASDKATEALVRRLLPVLDSLQHAASSAPASEGEDGAGLALVHRELLRTLEAEGLAAITTQRAAFDPLRHEAVQRAEPRACEAGEEPGLWVEAELRRGYALRGRVLRPAMVRVVERTVAQEPEPDSLSKERDA
jgi:molecular chaperone GrpE